jgi:hypothetical protein
MQFYKNRPKTYAKISAVSTCLMALSHSDIVQSTIPHQRFQNVPHSEQYEYYRVSLCKSSSIYDFE